MQNNLKVGKLSFLMITVFVKKFSKVVGYVIPSYSVWNEKVVDFCGDKGQTVYSL